MKTSEQSSPRLLRDRFSRETAKTAIGQENNGKFLDLIKTGSRFLTCEEVSYRGRRMALR